MPEKPTQDDLKRELEETAALRAGMTLAKANPMSFFYCSAGPHDTPVLLVGKNIKAEASAIKKKAKEKAFVRGTVSWEGDVFVFHADKPNNGKFEKVLKEVFGKRYTPLKKARVVAVAGAETATKEVVEKHDQAMDTTREEVWAARAKASRLDLLDRREKLRAMEAAIQAQIELGDYDLARTGLLKTLDRVRQTITRARRELDEAREA